MPFPYKKHLADYVLDAFAWAIITPIELYQHLFHRRPILTETANAYHNRVVSELMAAKAERGRQIDEQEEHEWYSSG